ncbi:MAG: hypothetical protein JO235_21560 [Chroococcidiopsidaceae cyanobacterium CP_BM_RX_35]|nr:hypothetical protein [Chroococcidiopsidaceae cyanobacterium CP_BM_RX_35]
MIISELSYLEGFSEDAEIVGGVNYSISLSVINGTVNVASEGIPLQKIDNGSNVTYYGRNGNSSARVSYTLPLTPGVNGVATSLEASSIIST